ncbi:Gfo/Idh/MocA family protein [Novosphingobium sp.]|uniref:Gfo/Idh/MocA family protein n=1 Tax=Novosphingobium sp. TaxID=1874826 RepID=UPI003B52B62D
MTSARLSRRGVLAAAVTAGLAAREAVAATPAIPPRAQSQILSGVDDIPDPMGDRMRWAVVGLGNFAVGHMMPAFLESRRARITALVSGSPAKAADLAARFGVARCYTYETFDQIAHDPQIDCVYIALPVGLHAAFAIRALQAGKHVLCEKPMASTSAECRAMIAAAHTARRQLGVAYRVHFDPFNRQVAQMIRSGEIGAVRYLSADNCFDANPAFPPHAWRLTKALGGGGSMFDYGIYGLNGTLMMLDDAAPTDVSAIYTTPAGDPRFAQVEGGVLWRMRFAGGVHAQGCSSYAMSHINRQLVTGTRGSLAMDPANVYDRNVAHRRRVDQPDVVIDTTASLPQFSAQIDAFSQAARDNVPHRTPGSMACAILP